MARLKGHKCHTKELIEPLPQRHWGVKDRFVQGGTSVQHVSHSPHYLPFPVGLRCQIMRCWATQSASLCRREAGPALKPVGHRPPPCNLCTVAGWRRLPGRARACLPLRVAASACWLHRRGCGPNARPVPPSFPCCQRALGGLKAAGPALPRAC